MVIVCCGLPVTAEVMGQLRGCGSVDPTDPNNFSEITILNDTPSAVVVADCPGAECHADQLPVRLSPGQSYGDDAACGSTGADMTSWRLNTSEGTLIGYIAVDMPRKHDGLVYRVSRASHDRHTPTPSG